MAQGGERLRVQVEAPRRTAAQFDANLGAGESFGVSGVISGDGAGVPGAPGFVGRAGFGYRMQAGVGPAATKKWASPALRCAN